MTNFKHVIACTDFSEVGNRAVEYAFSLVPDEGLVYLIHVVDPPPPPNPIYAKYVPDPSYDRTVQQDVVAASQHELQKLAIAAGGGTARYEIQVPLGNAVEEIIRLSREWPANLVVVGTHGRRGVTHMLLGSVAERVVRLAECPVLTVH